MARKDDFLDFGYFVKSLADRHSNGEIDDKVFIKILKEQLDVVRRDNE